MFCIYCGKEIDDNLLYCPFCGEKVDQDDETEIPEEPEVVEEPEIVEEPVIVEEPETEQPAVSKNKTKTSRIVIIAICALVAAGLGIGAFVMSGHDGNSEGQDPAATQAETQTVTEAVQDGSGEQSEATGQYVITEGVGDSISVHSWDLDFSNSEHINKDGTISYDSVMMVTNKTGRDITGIAYTVKNEYGDKVSNEDSRCVNDAPFYAQGYIPDGKTGVMVSEITVSEEEYKNENPKYDTGHRLKPKKVTIEEAYVFRENAGYSQATGRISGPYEGTSKECYTAEISNPNDSPVHKGSVIVAVKIDDDDNLNIRVASAKGRVDSEIPAGSKDFVINDAFVDPGLKDWPSNQYEVCVIDDEYGDGSYYDDMFREKYFK